MIITGTQDKTLKSTVHNISTRIIFRFTWKYPPGRNISNYETTIANYNEHYNYETTITKSHD